MQNKIKFKPDPLFWEALKNLLSGVIFSVSLLLTSALINKLIPWLSLENTEGIWLFQIVATYGSMIVFIIYTLKSFADMIILAVKSVITSVKSIRKKWKN